MPPKKKVIKEKKEKKIKQKQTQSQKVIINVNAVKNKPTRTRKTSKNTTNDISTGFIKYAPQDDREINTLKGKLIDVENKLLSIKNVKNPVNNNYIPPNRDLFSTSDNIGDWHNSKLFKDHKKQEEEKQKKNNLNKDIINQSKIFQLSKKLKDEKEEKINIKKTNLNKDIINQSKIFDLKKQIKGEKKETRKHVNLFMQSQFENDRLVDNIVKDRNIYNKYLNDIEIEKENEKREQAFMRENDINIKKLGRPTNEEQRRRYDMNVARKYDDTNFIDNE